MISVIRMKGWCLSHFRIGFKVFEHSLKTPQKKHLEKKQKEHLEKLLGQIPDEYVEKAKKVSKQSIVPTNCRVVAQLFERDTALFIQPCWAVSRLVRVRKERFPARVCPHRQSPEDHNSCSSLDV